ncbi:hypothetical protein OPV22_029544 [Ensete ventricosum]|uniref:Uncharacterized protein n=1 Tax=Ensete ventricosum TaxID=4639 RepID=A0AAV8P7F4_ENSVE|nr:hypothetical protein OPV22_029544 [Ensete ventricosum]
MRGGPVSIIGACGSHAAESSINWGRHRLPRTQQEHLHPMALVMGMCCLPSAPPVLTGAWIHPSMVAPIENRCRELITTGRRRQQLGEASAGAAVVVRFLMSWEYKEEEEEEGDICHS